LIPLAAAMATRQKLSRCQLRETASEQKSDYSASKLKTKVTSGTGKVNRTKSMTGAPFFRVFCERVGTGNARARRLADAKRGPIMNVYSLVK
jgi:hypothetical protein